MAGYSATPLWKKLGYKENGSAYVEGAPESYRQDLQLPTDFAVRWLRRADAGIARHNKPATKMETGRERSRAWLAK